MAHATGRSAHSHLFGAGPAISTVSMRIGSPTLRNTAAQACMREASRCVVPAPAYSSDTS